MTLLLCSIETVQILNSVFLLADCMLGKVSLHERTSRVKHMGEQCLSNSYAARASGKIQKMNMSVCRIDEVLSLLTTVVPGERFTAHLMYSLTGSGHLQVVSYSSLTSLFKPFQEIFSFEIDKCKQKLGG